MAFHWPWETGKSTREYRVEAAVREAYTSDGRYAWWTAWYGSAPAERRIMETTVLSTWSGTGSRE